MSPLPCPFCGCKPRVREWPRMKCAVVSCFNIKCHSNPNMVGDDAQEAIRLWNVRKEADE